MCGADLVRPPPEEEFARAVLSQFLPGKLVSHHPRPDFVLCHGGKPVGWVEVTRATDAATNRLWANVRKRGGKVTTRMLKHNWIVSFKTGADLRRLDTQRLIAALALEERIIDNSALAQSDPHGHRRLVRHNYPTIRRTLREFHIHSHHRLSPAEGSAKVIFNVEGHASFVDPNHITRLAEEKLLAKQKSLAGLTGELHLFILVDINERSGASVAVTDRESTLPQRLPQFPPWSTDVWLMATHFTLRLWHARRGSRAWEIFDIDPMSL